MDQMEKMLEVVYEISDEGYNILVKDDHFNFAIRHLLDDYINMNSNEYIDIMIKKFNGKPVKFGKFRKMIFFSNKEDVLEAIEWYKSMLIMDKLINPNN